MSTPDDTPSTLDVLKQALEALRVLAPGMTGLERFAMRNEAIDALLRQIERMERTALEQPADKTPASAFERAMKDSWGMVYPLDPPGTPGSYARGEHNGIVAALRTVRMNYERHAAPATQQQEGGTK